MVGNGLQLLPTISFVLFPYDVSRSTSVAGYASDVQVSSIECGLFLVCGKQKLAGAPHVHV